jgi:hypothetical protein
MASQFLRLKIAPITRREKKVHISKEDIRVISSGTCNRRTAIVPKSPATRRVPERKATQISIKENARFASGLPQNPSPARPRAYSRKSSNLLRRAHVRKKSNDTPRDEAEHILPGSPVAASPEPLSPTQERDYFPPLTSPGASIQRYPSSIFEDYLDEPESAIDSPVYTIDALKAQTKHKSSLNEDEHDIWGRYWTENMQADKGDGRRPQPQRTTTLQVAEMIRNRRKDARDYRMNTMESCMEECED